MRSCAGPACATCRYWLVGDWPAELGPRPAELATCALDVADLGPHTLEETSVYFGCTREWIRLLERQALAKLRVRLAAAGVDARSWCSPVGDPPGDEAPDDGAIVGRACSAWLATHAPRLDRRPGWPYRRRRKAA